MQPRMTKDIVLNALLMAVWRRNPQKQVQVHSDQGSQYTSHEWQSFLKSHGLEGSMSRRGNSHDNAVAESFFQLLKRERIKKKIYGTREEARSDIFDYIECFITVSVGMVRVIRCHRRNMKINIIRSV
ncbi:integrase-like protein [Raoultella planticola]|nr:integrase-like protein [Raoultella planticola]TDX34420.1 integrase-like protein [Raoultella planticola]